MNALEQIAQAITNVLRRKRSERLKLQLALSNFAAAREKPPKGMGSELEALNRDIRALETGLTCAMEEINNAKTCQA